MTLIVLCSLTSQAYGEKLKLKNEAPLFVSEAHKPKTACCHQLHGGDLYGSKDKQGLSSILSGILNTGPANMKEEDYKIEKFLKTSDMGISFSKE